MVELRSLQQAGRCTLQASVTAQGALPCSVPATADCPSSAKGEFDPELLPFAHSAHQAVPILPGDTATSRPGRSDAPGESPCPAPSLGGVTAAGRGSQPCTLQPPRDTQPRARACCPRPSSISSPRVLRASGCRGFPGTGPGTGPGTLPSAPSCPQPAPGLERSHHGHSSGTRGSRVTTDTPGPWKIHARFLPYFPAHLSPPWLRLPACCCPCSAATLQ